MFMCMIDRLTRIRTHLGCDRRQPLRLFQCQGGHVRVRELIVRIIEVRVQEKTSTHQHITTQ